VDSVLNGFRDFIRWRKQHEPLRLGSIEFLDAPEPALVFVRRHAGRALLVALNLSARDIAVPTAPGMRLRQIHCPGPANGVIERGTLKLGAHAAIYAEIE